MVNVTLPQDVDTIKLNVAFLDDDQKKRQIDFCVEFVG
jgi:hypothetical protein